MMSPVRSSAQGTHEYYEIRGYKLGEESDVEAIDAYLRDALVPALNRHGIGPIGAFTNSENDETGNPRIFVVIPYGDAGGIQQVKSALASDPEYQAAAKSFLEREPKDAAYQRIESEMLVAMKCMPKLKVSDGSLDNQNRVYELRIYESSNEHRGDLKVDMFNSGEVPIFLDCGIHPVFIGQGLIGPYTPNLTYLTTYPDEAARLAAWKAFRTHPDWLVLKEVAKYKGTVSKIHKYVLVPKSYSQM